MKIFWVCGPAPTGHDRSFQSRAWPMAHLGRRDGPPLIMLTCATGYRPSDVRNASHPEITLHAAYHEPDTFTWRRLKRTAATLAEAKILAGRFLAANPGYVERAKLYR